MVCLGGITAVPDMKEIKGRLSKNLSEKKIKKQIHGDIFLKFSELIRVVKDCEFVV